MGDGFLRQTVENTHKSTVVLWCGFATNGASSPTAAQIFGNVIASVSHTGTGVYTVTLKKDYWNMDLVAKFAHLSLSAAADSVAQCGPYDKTAGTLTVRTLTAGSAADVAANADNFVSLELVARYGRNQDGCVLYDS